MDYKLIKITVEPVKQYSIAVRGKIVGTVYYEPTELVAVRWRARVVGPTESFFVSGPTRRRAVEGALDVWSGALTATSVAGSDLLVSVVNDLEGQ